MSAHAPTTNARLPTASTVAAGTRIGPWKIVKILGRGGMGSVFEAIHDSDGTRSAIKVLHPEYAHNDKLVRRFFNEARAVMQIGHANIVEVYEFGHTTRGHCFLRMEILDGRPLSAELAESARMDVRRACYIAGQVTRALAASHAVGIVHRDLKPQNIFLARAPDGSERVKVLDFGVAKLLKQSSFATDQTESGAVIGTTRYMSPEQCRSAKGIDQRTDIYSLGFMLYMMIAGRMPFDAETPGDLVVKHLTERPRPITDFVPDVPAELAAIIARTLEKDPAARFQRMDDLGDALAPFGGPTRPAGREPLPVWQSSALDDETSDNEADGAALELDAATVLLEEDSAQSERPANGAAASAHATTVSEAATPRRSWAIAIAASAAALSLAVVMLGLWSHRAPPPATATPVAPAAAAPAEIAVSILSHPAGASVFVDGAKEAAGIAPLVLRRPPNARPLSVRLELDGYAPFATDVALESNRTLDVTLVARPSPPKHTKRHKPTPWTGSGEIIAPKY